MDIKNEIKSKLAASGFTLTQVVEKMNEGLEVEKRTTVQNISNKLARGTIKYSEVREIAEIIGMKMSAFNFADTDLSTLYVSRIPSSGFSSK